LGDGLRSARSVTEREKVGFIYDAGKNGLSLEAVLERLKIA
jgi:hypothetical protein